MRTFAQLSLSSSTIPAAQRSTLERAIAALLDHAIESVEGIRQSLLNRRRRRAWRQDLPWDVGMDHLAETGHPPWVPRGN